MSKMKIIKCMNVLLLNSYINKINTMKKKTRSIIVDNTSYDWSVVENLWPNGTLKVWIGGSKNNLLLETPIQVLEPIKPSHVAAFIRNKISK